MRQQPVQQRGIDLCAMLDGVPHGVDHQAFLSVVVHDGGYRYDGDE